MFYQVNKIRDRINEIKNYQYQDVQPVLNIKVKEDISKTELVPPQIDDSFTDIAMGHIWKGRDYYLWLCTTLNIKSKAHLEPCLLIDFGKTGAGNNSGFESLIYLNNKMYQGVDSNHQEVFLKEEHLNQDLSIALKLWSGLEGGGHHQMLEHRLNHFNVAYLNKRVKDLYYLSNLLLNTALCLKENHHDYHTILNMLDTMTLTINWTNPGDEAFYESCYQALTVLEATLAQHEKKTDVVVNAIGHTHIDVAWLWRLKHTKEKCLRSFSTVLRMMERYDHYIFLQTQPQLYQYVKEMAPELYAAMKERIKEGRFEVDGGMWLEADCNLVSGESLVRQLYYGINFIKKEFNKDVNYLWLPDVFGYSWALPQILKLANIKTFMTTKISWNQYNRMPADTFVWKGIDGSEILTHFITTPESWNINDPSSWFYTYNGQLEPEIVKGIYDAYRNKDINSELLLSYGYGDGGGGVNVNMLENAAHLDKMPGLSHFKTSTAKEYFEKLHDNIDNTKRYVHKFDGELYLEYHRGTYTTQAFIKKNNRNLENLLRNTELLNTYLYASKQCDTYYHELFDQAWTILLRNQFHDIIPGSSIKEVYDDAKLEYNEAFAIVDKINNYLNEGLINQEDGFIVINNEGFVRNEIILYESQKLNLSFKYNDQSLVATYYDNTYHIEVSDLQPYSINNIKINTEEDCLSYNEFVSNISTPFYDVLINEDGHLSSIIDKRVNKEILDSASNLFTIYEDKPMAHEAWDIDIYYKEKYEYIKASKLGKITKNQLFTSIEIDYIYNKSTIKQVIYFYENSPRIDFKTKVNWYENQKLLKVNFNFALRANFATFDIQFGNVKRSNNWNTSWDYAKFESVMHKYVDYSQNSYGVALLNNCKYGGHVLENNVGLTLLKSSNHPDPSADRGYHEFSYSLLPHDCSFNESNVIEEAYQFNNPLLSINGLGTKQEMLKIESDYVYHIDALKMNQTNKYVVLRLHDDSGNDNKVTIKPQFSYSGWCETDLLEKENNLINDDIILDLKPYEIKTILLKVEV